MKVSDDGRALGGRNGTIGPVIAPSLTRSVRSSPSLPITYSGSTPPNAIGASTGLVGTGGATSRGARATAGGRTSLSTAAPLPGSPTALFAPLPPSPSLPPKAEGASVVRRLGVARSPPGHSRELGGCPPVATAEVRCVVQYGRARSVSTANSRSALPPTKPSALNPR